MLAVVGLTRRSGKSWDRDLLALSPREVEIALAGFLDGGAVDEGRRRRDQDVYLCDGEGLVRMMRAATDERADGVKHAERALDGELARWSGARWAGLPPATRPCNDGDLTAVPQGE